MMDTITTGDGCRIAYRFDGDAEAPVLVLSNSLGTNLAMWEPQMAAFTERFRVLRYDSRGHGGSGTPPGSYSIDRLGRDVIELADALGLQTFTFCGLSMGGMVGQWLGWRAPERLEQLILANTAPYMGPPAGWDERIASVRREGMSAVSDAVIARWFTPEFAASNPAAIAPVRDMLLATNPDGYAACCAAIRDMDQRPMLALIARPVLVIAGDADPATPLDQLRHLAKSIAHSQSVVLPAAHLSNIEQPIGFSEGVIGFAG